MFKTKVSSSSSASSSDSSKSSEIRKYSSSNSSKKLNSEVSDKGEDKVILYNNFSPFNAFLVGPFKVVLSKFREEYLTPSDEFHYCPRISLGKGWFIPKSLLEYFITLLEDQDFDFEIKDTPVKQRAQRPTYKKVVAVANILILEELEELSDDAKYTRMRKFIEENYAPGSSSPSKNALRKAMTLPLLKSSSKKKKASAKGATKKNSPTKNTRKATNYMSRIAVAISKLSPGGKKPVSRQAIKKYILANYKVSEKLINSFLRKNIIKGLENGNFGIIKQSYLLTEKGRKELL